MLPSRKQRSSSVWHSTYRAAEAIIPSSSAAADVRPGTDCGTSVRYGHSRPVNAPLFAAAAVTARPRSTTRSWGASASRRASRSGAAAAGTGPGPSSRCSSNGLRTVTPGSASSGAIRRLVRTGALSTRVTSQPAAASAWVTDCSQMADPSIKFRSMSP